MKKSKGKLILGIIQIIFGIGSAIPFAILLFLGKLEECFWVAGICSVALVVLGIMEIKGYIEDNKK